MRDCFVFFFFIFSTSLFAVDSRAIISVQPQILKGLPVEHGFIKELRRPRTDGSGYEIIADNSRVAVEPRGGFRPERVNRAQALSFVQKLKISSNLHSWSVPEKIIYTNPNEPSPAVGYRVWKIHGENFTSLESPSRYAFYVDAVSGRILHIEDEIYHIDITGSVFAKRSPGLLPDISSNSAVDLPLPYATIARSLDGVGVQSGQTGDFIFPNASSSSVNLFSFLSSPWVRVVTASGGRVAQSLLVPPPGPADFQLNVDAIESRTAQTNAFFHTNLTHDFVKSLIPNFRAIDAPVVATVNLNDSCNAYYTNSTINFFRSNANCVNTAYASVVAHEYGHFVVEKLNLAQGAFGEGFADSLAELMYDDYRAGPHFFTNGNSVRDPMQDSIQYPCSNEIHICGEVLSGVWWRIKLAFENIYGAEEGRRQALNLFANWMQWTRGGSGSDAAHPQTAVEVLQMDDDNHSLDDGTPHYEAICQAFSQHGIACPGLHLFNIELTRAPQTPLRPQSTFEIRASITPAVSGYELANVILHFSINDEAEQTVVMNRINQSHEYSAHLTSSNCLDRFNYYIEIQPDHGISQYFPDGGRFLPTHIRVAMQMRAVANYDFNNLNDGWTIHNINVTQSPWERAIADGEAFGSPSTDYDGSQYCFRTGTTQPLQGGPTELISPVFELQNLDDIEFSYARWYQSFTNFGNDRFDVQVSIDGGNNWTRVETVRGTTVDWVMVKKSLSSLGLPAQGSFRIKFLATSMDPYAATLVGALDAVSVVGFSCHEESDRLATLDDLGTFSCGADFNHDGQVTSSDLVNFIAAFESGDRAADINRDGMIDFFDYTEFLGMYESGC